MLSTLLSVVLVINEMMASNLGEVMSPATNFDSWIELYNPGDEPVSLTGMYLSNDIDNLTLWKIPANVGSVPAKGFKVIWLGSNDIRKNQAPFKLDCDGGFIYLTDTDGSKLIINQPYPSAISHTAYARTNDGGDLWGWTAYPTPEASNSTAKFASQRLDPPTVSVGSKLFNGTVSFKVNIPKGATLMYTTDGSVPMPPRTDNGQGQPTEPSQPTTTNWIVNGDCEGDDATCFVSYNGDEGKDVNRITDGVGYQGSRGIKVHAINNATNDYDTQFFVYTPDHVWQVGEHYRFSMMVRADKPATISTQSHTTPHNYIYWSMLNGEFTVNEEWKELTYDGYITNDQAGSNGIQTIAFNLNKDMRLENNYYFDNIVWESVDGTADINYSISVRNNPGMESKTGEFSFSTTTNFCCRLFCDSLLPSAPVTRSFIKTSQKYTIPIVSIVGDDKYYNDDVWGIDVIGTNGIPGHGRDDAVNWNQPWDRPVNFSYISPDGEMLFNQDVNTSVSGGWSRKEAPRSFKLKSNKAFDGLNHLDYPFFPQKPYIRNKALLVRNGGNDNYCRFMDPAMQTAVQRSGINLDIQSTLQVAEFINGEFRGIMNLRETNNDKYVYANWGYDDEKIDYFENFTFNNGNAEAWNRLMELSENINDEGVYDEVKKLLDIDEFTNYMAVEMFLGNSDWPNNNVKGYRSQKDGRFRFILFDLDQIFNRWCDMKSLSTLDGQFYNEPLVRLLRNLLANDEYRKKFLDTFCIMGGSVFERERITAMVNEMAEVMGKMMQIEDKSPEGTANEIKSKMKTRFDEALSQLRGYQPARIEGLQTQTVQLSADTPGAHILLNGIDLPYADFKGYLFQPIRLEAKAPAGYRFAGWTTGDTSRPTNSLIAKSSLWKYYDKGEATQGWQGTNFDDAKWSSGDAPLGYKMAVATTISYGNNANNKYLTAYFRKAIKLDDAPKSDDVFQLNYQVDDGFVIYVNGQEAGRANMRPGSVDFNTNSQTYAGDDPLEGSINLSPSLFHSGTNVIAVEVHNTSNTSSDFFWDCELLTTVGADTDDNGIADPVIDLPADDTVNLIAKFEPLEPLFLTDQYITPVRINEVSAANDVYVSEYWKKHDWVELYNTTDQPIDVEGMWLTDNIEEKPQKYQISKEMTQAGTVIPAHGYLVVWCSKKYATKDQLHAPFNIDDDGDHLMLTAADGSWNDVFSYPKHNADQSVGRFPDGSNNVCVMNIPTIAKANIATSYMVQVNQPYRPDPATLAPGDANGDGEVNILDVTAIISQLGGNTPAGFHASAADIVPDRTINAADLRRIVEIVTGITNKDK